MKQPRDFQEVMDRLIRAIPKTEVATLVRLTAVANSALFTAPEMMVQRWSDARDILIDAATNASIDAQWPEEVEAIFTGRDVADV